MARSTLTKRMEFSASHRYHNPDWDEARNRAVFGPCAQEHGHNYLLEVTLGGRVDPVTGMILNLYDLKRVVTDVLEEFDHRHLNLDTPCFARLLPTTENFAMVLWRKFRARPETRDIEAIRLGEGDALWAEVRTPKADPDAPCPEEPDEAVVTRRYDVEARYRSSPSWIETRPLTLDVTVRGPVDPLTGRVTDIAALDAQVTRLALQCRSHAHPLPAPPRASQTALAATAECLWPRLVETAGARLERLTLNDRRETTLEYSRLLR